MKMKKTNTKKKIHVQTGSKKPGEHWKEVEAEVVGPFAYYEVEVEPWGKGDPPRIKFALVHTLTGTHISKRTSEGFEPPPYGGIGGSSEYYWPSEEFVRRTIAKVRERTTDRQWRFTDQEAVSEKKLRGLVNMFLDAEREVKAESLEEFKAAKVARYEAKEARREKREREAERAVEEGEAIYVLSTRGKKVPALIVKQYGSYIALHRGLAQWRATSWWYVSHIPSGNALFKSKSKRLARKAASLLVEKPEAFWRFKDVDRLSAARRDAVVAHVKGVRDVMGR